jgi:hypothetical protein
MNSPYIGFSHHGPLTSAPDTTDEDEALVAEISAEVEGGAGEWAILFAERNELGTHKEFARLLGALIRWQRYGDEAGLCAEATSYSDRLDRYIAEQVAK